MKRYLSHKYDSTKLEVKHMLIKYTGKNKFIFIANTKCASTSIENSEIAKIADIKLTYSNIQKHMSIGKVHETFEFIFNEFNHKEFFKFGIIRNPLDWVVSWYNFRSRIQLSDPSHPNHGNYTGNMTFAEFWYSNNTKPFLNPQYQKFFANDRGIELDYIMLQERLDDDLFTIQKILGIDLLNIEKRNKSTIKRISPSDVDLSIQNKIRERYHRDYDLINNIEEFNSKYLYHSSKA